RFGDLVLTSWTHSPSPWKQSKSIRVATPKCRADLVHVRSGGCSCSDSHTSSSTKFVLENQWCWLSRTGAAVPPTGGAATDHRNGSRVPRQSHFASMQ